MNITVEKVSKFIKDSIKTLLETENTCCRFELDDNLALFIGWSGGFDEELDTTIYQDKNDMTYAICMKIANTKEYVWADYDFNDMPYYKDTGDVYDTDSSIPRFDNYSVYAKCYINSYLDILEENKKGLLII